MMLTMLIPATTLTPATMTDLEVGQDRFDALEALARSLGTEIVSARQFHSEVTGQGITTGHELELQSPDGSRGNHIVYLESNPSRTDLPGVFVLRDPATEAVMAMWLYPNDPRLPTLATAVYPEAAAVLLKRLGFDPTGITLEIVSYRPGKRAVVRVTVSAGTLYLKVVRPEVSALIRRRHELWLESGIPVPGVLASAEGIVVLDRLPGVEAITLVPALASDDGFLDALAEVVVRIAGIPSEAPARPSLVARLDWYFGHLHALAPASSAVIAAMKSNIQNLYRDGGPPPSVTIHGDLHLAQIFVHPERPNQIIGILDIDTAGFGDPADDAAALFAHLLVTAEYRQAQGENSFADHARGLAERSRQRWVGSVDRGFSARATAIAMTHLCGHALSGSVTVARALVLAGEVFALYEDERALTAGYFVSHAADQG